MNEYRYLIIAGTTKAATTSVFNYLADHPKICASNIKETGFFLDPDYPLPAKYRLEDGLAKYESYFIHCSASHIRMEATPDYLYSPCTPQKIKTSLPLVKIIFVLREPIDRLVSWYRFAKQIAGLPAQVDFEQYVNSQLRNNGSSSCIEQHMRALEQGRYSVYLKPYLDLFEQDQVFIAQYETLKRDPADVLDEVCLFAGIDPAFYVDYDFRVFNPTQSMKSARLHRSYMEFRVRLGMRVHDNTRIRMVLRFIRRKFEPLYLRLNRGVEEEVVISEPMRALLEDYYSGEAAALACLLGTEHFS